MEIQNRIEYLLRITEGQDATSQKQIADFLAKLPTASREAILEVCINDSESGPSKLLRLAGMNTEMLNAMGIPTKEPPRGFADSIEDFVAPAKTKAVEAKIFMEELTELRHFFRDNIFSPLKAFLAKGRRNNV